MLLDSDFVFYEKTFTSSASRKLTTYGSFFNIKHKFHFLSLKVKNKSGRNDTGLRVIRTKTSILRKNKSIKINYKLNYTKPGIMAAFSFIPFKNKVASLIFFNNGYVTYFLTTENHKLFSLINFKKKKKTIKKVVIPTYYSMLCKIKKLSYISCVELLPNSGSKYSRSPGTKCRILSFDEKTHSSVLILPSKLKKIFSYYAHALFGQILLSNHKKYYNGKAGYWRTFGLKPIVRGVAMNAVDHPHGGRTKSVRYQRTPWGKTTKFK
uniref:Ribosomal protein L2 n=1 Tax=Paraurostyla sp. TaxID=6014 RepID=A0A3S6K4S8_9STIC|nr:ribosomal protein L2 [Paraurostyla sp.]